MYGWAEWSSADRGTQVGVNRPCHPHAAELAIVSQPCPSVMRPS
jgi:hypothetical protein